MVSCDVDDFLMLSGIQHFAFCKRQWALIHIEQQWQENYLTFCGKRLHKNADNPYTVECRGDLIISRAMPVQSSSLRLTGVADVVEFHRTEEGASIKDHPGLWEVVPVEYKAGKKKQGDCDEVQLCAQAICLEEMFNTRIPRGYLFYGKTRRRTEVIFSDSLREHVRSLVSEMYQLYERGITPAAVPGDYCQRCSLVDICVPHLGEKRISINMYLDKVSEDRL